MFREIDIWLQANVDQLLAASNFTVATYMIVLGTTIIYFLINVKLTGKTDLFYMLIGVVLESYGWAVHRIYWGLRRVSSLYDNDHMLKWFLDHAYIGLIPALMIIIGLVLILGPMLSFAIGTNNRKKFYFITLIFIMSTWWFTYWKMEEGYLSATISKHQNPTNPQIDLLGKDNPYYMKKP